MLGLFYGVLLYTPHCTPRLASRYCALYSLYIVNLATSVGSGVYTIYIGGAPGAGGRLIYI